VPDHSSFSKNRHGRFRDSDAFRFVFETVLRRCMTEGLVGGEGFAVDASVVKADAHRAHARPGESHIDWKKGGRATRSVREYLEALDLKDQQTQPAMRIEQHQKGEGDFRTTLESLISVPHGLPGSSSVRRSSKSGSLWLLCFRTYGCGAKS